MLWRVPGSWWGVGASRVLLGLYQQEPALIASQGLRRKAWGFTPALAKRVAPTPAPTPVEFLQVLQGVSPGKENR